MTATAALPVTVPFEAPLEALYPDPRQPRKHIDDAALEELAASIRVHGVLEPLIVHPQLRQDKQAGYTIVAGERRWRAAKRAGLKTVPVVVRAQLTVAQIGEIQLIENLQREDLTAVELATGYAAYLKATGKSQAELAKAVGKDEGTVSHHLALLTLPPEIQQLVSDRTLSFAHARELARLVPHPKALARVAKYVGERIHWGNVPTTRTMKRYVDSELDRERRRQKAAAAKKKGGGRRAAPTSAIQDNLEWKRRQALQEIGQRARAKALKAELPTLVQRFRKDRLVQLVKKIPGAIAAAIAREFQPGWWSDQRTIGEHLVRHGPGAGYGKIAAVLWLRPRWGALDRQFTVAALKAIAAEQTKAVAPKRKGGGK
jgi:ParB family chromosome partitioning protein